MKFEYHQPETLEAVVDLLARHGSEAAPLAGGTALLIDMQQGELEPAHLVSLWGVRGLDEIRLNGEAQIGSLATLTDLAEAIRGVDYLTGLLEAARTVGGRQIQNMATLGGNICKASPGADMVPPLLCLDAELELAGPEGQRIAGLDGFLTGPDQTDLKLGEVLTRIKLPPAEPRTGTAFLKIMRRQAVDCSIVAAAARITLAEDGRTCAQARIAVGAAAPNPFRARRAEAALAGNKLDPERVRQAAALAKDESQPIDDIRASADYRRWLVETLVARALLTAEARAKEAEEA